MNPLSDLSEAGRRAWRALFAVGVTVSYGTAIATAGGPVWLVRGNTYPIRAVLRERGFEYYPRSREWTRRDGVEIERLLVELLEAHHAHERRSEVARVASRQRVQASAPPTWRST